MPLVGDIIMSAREQIPDMPQTVSPPLQGLTTAAVGGTLLPTTWYVVETLLTNWGESLPSNEVAVTLSPGVQTLSVPWYEPAGPFTNVIGVRVYFGINSGQEDQYVEYIGTISSTSPIPNPILISSPGTAGSPPTFNSAYLPDTSGKFINNYSMFRWLNEGLNILSKKTGGILDATGVPTAIGQPLYRLPFKWIQLNKIWFDGWELIKGTRSDIFYRNAITAISNLTVTLRQAEYSILEVFPQPNRTGGSAVTAAPIGFTDTFCPLSQVFGWVLPFGLAWLNNPGVGYEIVSYSSMAGGQLSGMFRALGGTPAGLWPAGTQVRELNLRVSGYRMANTYRVGDSPQYIPVPDGWSDILPIYIDSKALSVQGDKSGASKRMQEFLKLGQELASASQLLQGPVQIGLASTNEVYNPGLGGGWYLQ